MKNANLLEQYNRYATAFSLTYLGAQFAEQCFDIAPPNIAARRTSENQIKGALVLPLHSHMVPESGTGEIEGCGWPTFEFTGPRGFRAHVCSMSSAGNDPRAFTAPSMTPAKPKWRRSSRPHRRCRRGGWPGWRSNIPRWFHGLSDIPTSSTPLYRRRNKAPWLDGTPGKPWALQPIPPASRPNTSKPLGSKCRPG